MIIATYMSGTQLSGDDEGEEKSLNPTTFFERRVGGHQAGSEFSTVKHTTPDLFLRQLSRRYNNSYSLN